MISMIKNFNCFAVFNFLSKEKYAMSGLPMDHKL